MAQDLLPDSVVRYADHEDAVVDLHVPDVPNGTLVVLIHGGFWKQAYDRTHTRAQARSLADAGFLVATPEYRRVGGDGGWPITADDVEGALRSLPGLLTDSGLGWDRAVLVGHSAGGHLALLMAGRNLPLAFATVVAVAPVCDLASADVLDLGDGAVARFLDGAPIGAADPMTLLKEEPDTSVRLVHGIDDDTVPIELSRGFVEHHRWAHLTELRGTGHFEFLDPRSAAWVAVARELG